MKTTVITKLSLTAIAMVFLCGCLWAQAPEKVYVEVGCIKAKSDALLPFMMEKGTAFNKQAQKMGLIDNWVLMQVMYPNGEDCECDFRSITAFSSMKQLDDLTKGDTGMQIAGAAFGEQAQAVYEEWVTLAAEKGSAIYEMKVSGLDQRVNVPLSSMRFHNVAPDKLAEFEAMESEVWKPLVVEAIKEGALSDWHVWERIMPSGSNFDGNYVTVANFESFAHMGAIDMAQIGQMFEKVHPGKNIMDAVAKSQSLSEVVKEETAKTLVNLAAEMQQ